MNSRPGRYAGRRNPVSVTMKPKSKPVTYKLDEGHSRRTGIVPGRRRLGPPAGTSARCTVHPVGLEHEPGQVTSLRSNFKVWGKFEK